MLLAMLQEGRYLTVQGFPPLGAARLKKIFTLPMLTMKLYSGRMRHIVEENNNKIEFRRLSV